MSFVEKFSCIQVEGGAPGRRFEIDRQEHKVRGIVTGWRAWIQSYREGKSLIIEDEVGKRLALLYCSIESRSLTEEEAMANSANVISVITWSVDWPIVYDLSPPDTRITKEYIIEFFCFYKGRNGVALYIDGKPKDAIVNVNIANS